MQLRVSTMLALAVTAALMASCARQEAAAPTAAPAAPAEQPSASQATGTTTTFDNQAQSQPEAPAKPTQ